MGSHPSARGKPSDLGYLVRGGGYRLIRKQHLKRRRGSLLQVGGVSCHSGKKSFVSRLDGLLELLFRPKYAKNRHIGAMRAMRVGDLFGDGDSDGASIWGLKFDLDGFHAGVWHQHTVHTP